MDDIRCSYCGGKYIDLTGQEDGFEKKITYCYCNGCKRDFMIETPKRTTSGEWLLTLYARDYQSSEVRFYRNVNGVIEYTQKMHNRCVTYSDAHMYYIVAGRELRYRHGDGAGMSDMRVAEIKLSPAMKSKAMQNEAMRTIFVSGDTFSLNNVRNNDLVMDVYRWLSSATGGVDSKTYYKKGGCYVATCVYGSYDCPQVWTLRRYRDDSLSKSRLGRLFVRCYYAVSPAIVKWFGHCGWMKAIWKCLLDHIVDNLHAKGVEDTPYEDRNW